MGTHATLDVQSLQTAEWITGKGGAFAIVIVTDFTYKSKTSRDIRSCTRACDTDSWFFFFFFPEDLQNLQKEIIPTPSTPPIHPHDPSNEGFRQIYFSKHLWTLGGKVGVCLQKEAFVKWSTGIMLHQAAGIWTYPAMQEHSLTLWVPGPLRSADKILAFQRHSEFWL